MDNIQTTLANMFINMPYFRPNMLGRDDFGGTVAMFSESFGSVTNGAKQNLKDKLLARGEDVFVYKVPSFGHPDGKDATTVDYAVFGSYDPGYYHPAESTEPCFYNLTIQPVYKEPDRNPDMNERHHFTIGVSHLEEHGNYQAMVILHIPTYMRLSDSLIEIIKEYLKFLGFSPKAFMEESNSIYTTPKDTVRADFPFEHLPWYKSYFEILRETYNEEPKHANAKIMNDIINHLLNTGFASLSSENWNLQKDWPTDGYARWAMDGYVCQMHNQLTETSVGSKQISEEEFVEFAKALRKFNNHLLEVYKQPTP